MSGGAEASCGPYRRAKSKGLRDFSYLAQRADKSEFLMIIIAAVCCNRVILPSDAALWPVVSRIRLLLHAISCAFVAVPTQGK
jgi:hypothetical protein